MKEIRYAAENKTSEGRNTGKGKMSDLTFTTYSLLFFLENMQVLENCQVVEFLKMSQCPFR
jgi:hypothetical protein